MQYPAEWEAPKRMGADKQAMWHRCLTLLVARGILAPHHKIWLEFFCGVICHLDRVRRTLAGLPPNADRGELDSEEIGLAGLLLEQLKEIGFESEAEFREALSRTV